MKFEKNIIILLYFFLPILSAAQTNKVDSLLTLLKIDKEDTLKVIHLNKICWQYNLQGENDRAIMYGDSAVKLALRLNFPSGYARAYGNLGSIYSDRKEFDSAWKMLRLALKTDKESNNKKGIATVTANIGALYDAQQNYPKALELSLAGLKMMEDIGDEYNAAGTMTNIGDIYFEQGEPNKALDYYLKSLAIYEREHETFNRANILGNIGGVYETQKKYDQALEYYQKALVMHQSNNDKVGIAITKLNIGQNFEHKGDHVTALKYEMDALEIYNEMKDKEHIDMTMGNIGASYASLANYKDAENYLMQSYNLAKSIGDIEGVKNDCIELSGLYAKMGQTQKAFDYYKQYVAAKDSLINKETIKEIGHIEAKAEFDKQLTSQQAEADKKAALDEAEKKRQFVIILLIAAIAIAAIAIAISVSQSLKTARKQKMLVEKQKVEQELKALRAQMNPHFIFNAINSIKNVVLENDSAAASRHLSKFSKLMREVLENSRYEFIPLAKEVKMLELYMELESLRFSSKFQFKISIDESVNPENVLISPLIIQPYVENAIWHGLMHLQNTTGMVSINIENEDNTILKCTIDDNGIGREKSVEMKKNKTHNSMGLSLTQDRLAIFNSMNKGRMDVHFIDKKNNNGSSGGTKVELFLPLIQREF